MQIHEPSPICDERTSSTLNPGETVKLSADVALGTFNTSPHGLSPSLPWLTALVHELSSNPLFCHPAVSLADVTQLGSLTTNSLFLLLSLSSSITRTPAVSLATFLPRMAIDRKSTRLNSSHSQISYAVFCLKKKS